MANNIDNHSEHANNKRLTTFASLKYSGYRYLWLGQLGHSATMWMEQVVRPLLILELTGSALQVGLVVSLRMIPQLLFGLLAGVIADRYNKRRVLMLSQMITLLTHVAMAVLLLTGNLEVWHVYVTAIIAGASMAFNQPARQSMVPRLVPPETLLNALSLNTAAMNIMRIFGASLAGVLLIFFDYGEVFSLNAIIFIFVIWTTYKIKLTETSTEKRTSLAADFAEGFRYVFRNPVLLYIVILALLIFIFGLPYQQVFIPLLALDVLEIGRSGAGWLLAFTGIGALIGSLTVASLRQVSRRGMILMGMLILLSAALVLLAQSRWFALSAVAAIFAGGAGTAFLAFTTSLLLEKSPPAFHGRVVSLMSLDRGLVSIGAIIAGALAEGMGPQWGLTVLAGACIAFTILMFLFLRPLRKIS